MSRSTFIAARNSRHRTAALALYRALIRTASRIPVAQDVAQKPISQIVRRRVEKNSGYTSFRLIYAAMAAGYKFLNLLTKAQTPNSPEHTQIMQHLQSIRDTAAASRAIPHPPQYKPVLPAEPLLINTAKANDPPKYTSNILPRPKNSLTGPRKVPSVSATADGQPFVRLKKPQPHVMSRMIGRKNRIFESRIMNILDIDERVVPEAALEDEWDRMMDELLAEEGSKKGRRKQQDLCQSAREDRSKMETFGWSVQLSRLWWELKIERTWEDWIARGEALHQLVEQERSLDERERGRSDATKRKGNNNRRAASRRSELDYDDAPPNVGLSPIPALPLLEVIRSTLPRDEALEKSEEAQDPFLSPSWAALVKSQEGRMLKWAGKRVVGQRGD
ncbi:hypothetical protein HDV62DRAFT_350350 [Trichoderma sp. SZMC 28011]